MREYLVQQLQHLPFVLGLGIEIGRKVISQIILYLLKLSNLYVRIQVLILTQQIIIL